MGLPLVSSIEWFVTTLAGVAALVLVVALRATLATTVASVAIVLTVLHVVGVGRGDTLDDVAVLVVAGDGDLG